MARGNMLAFARDIALHAGAVLLEGFRSGGTVVSYKSRTDLVTNMDRASEAYLYDAISAKFPDHTIIAEEGSRKEAAGDFLWYVDPLDGTNNYAHGLPFFCVSLGVYSRSGGRVVAGVVYNPYHGEMFCASAGGGAFLNDRPIHVSTTSDIGVSIVATGFPYDKHLSDENNLPEFNSILPRVQGVRRMGSAALDLCYVACGRMDGYWERKLSPWDCAGGSVIVEEAGGTVTRFDGSAFNPEYPEVLASNSIIHGQMIGILARKTDTRK